VGAIGVAARGQVVADGVGGADGLGHAVLEAVGELFRRAIGGHGQFAGQGDAVLGAVDRGGELQDPALDAPPGRGLGVGAVGGGDHDQAADACGELLGESQSDHAAVGAADEGVGARGVQVIQHQGEKTGLVLGGDGDRGGVREGLRREVDGQDAQGVQVDRAAFGHRARPPAEAVGLGAVDEAAGRDAAGDDDQRTVGPAVQAGGDDRLAQAFARQQAEIGGDGNEDVARLGRHAFSAVGGSLTERLQNGDVGVERHCRHRIPAHQGSCDDRSWGVASSTLHSSLAAPGCFRIPRRSWHRFGRNPMVAPASKGLIPQPVLMSAFRGGEISSERQEEYYILMRRKS